MASSTSRTEAPRVTGPDGEPSQTMPPSTTIPAEQPTKEKPISYLSLPNKGQLAILCVARIADPLATTSISAYMFYQLKFFDPSASNSKVSTQAGIIVGAKTAAQVVTGMLWGRLADSEWGGRKPVLVIGLLSCCLSSIGYGFSRSFGAAVGWQVFGGAMNNVVAIVRCVVAELNPEKKYRTRALLLLPLCANAASLLGPLIGGLLSYRTGDGPLKPYPYAPPNLVVAALFLIAALGVFFGLQETLEGYDPERSFAPRLWEKIKSLATRPGSNTPAESNEQAPLIPKPHHKKGHLPFRRIWTFNVCCTMLSHFIIAGHLGTFASLWVIFLSVPVQNPGEQHPPINFSGGLGMPPRDVGFAMSLLGAIGVLLQLVLYPMLNDRFGTVKIWRAALFVFPIVYIVAPYPSLVASLVSGNSNKAFVWVAVVFVLLLYTIGRTGVTPATTLLINDCTPHPSARGTIHAAGTLMGHLSRSIFPVAALAIFGKGLNIGVVGLGFWCLAILAILACVVSGWVSEGSNGKEIVLSDDEEEEEPTNGSGSGTQNGNTDSRRT